MAINGSKSSVYKCLNSTFLVKASSCLRKNLKNYYRAKIFIIIFLRIPFLNKSDLKTMHALAKNLIIDSMTKEPDFIFSIRKMISYSNLESIWKTRHFEALRWMESMWKKTASLTNWLETTINKVQVWKTFLNSWLV